MDEKVEEPKHFVVNRGIKIEAVTAVARWWTLLHGEKTPQTVKQLEEQTRKIKDIKGDYSGVYFANHFKVDRAIQLTDLGFLGPFHEVKSCYSVQIELFKPKNHKELLPTPSSHRIAQHCQKIITAEDFYVGFQAPIPIEPHQWYLIQFVLNNRLLVADGQNEVVGKKMKFDCSTQLRLDTISEVINYNFILQTGFLKGPDTFRCEKTLHSVNVKAGNSSVNFDFSTGSKQMHSLRFTYL